MQDVYQDAAVAARDGRAAALAVVTRADGSTPQFVGARMLVYADGTVTGTVGGGAVEHHVLRRAAALASSGGPPALLELDLETDLGMSCGGAMGVLLSAVTRRDAWLEEVTGRRQQGLDSWISTSLEPDSLGERMVGGAPPAGAHEQPEVDPCLDHAAVVEGPPRVLVEHLCRPARLLVFGAGHVGQPTARLGAMLGYHVVVVDDRPEWNSGARFPEAAERAVEPFAEYLARYRARPSDAVVIVTRGHAHDQLVLDAVVGSGAAYIGMIGSRRKVAGVLGRLRERGVPDSDVDAVQSPIGLDIGARTPEEIAVSIAAEIVARRRGASDRVRGMK